MAKAAAAAGDADITVVPELLGFKYPCDGTSGATKLKITNGTKEKQTFKVKLTRPDRFRIGPPFGFLEPDKSAMVKIKPNAFDGTKPLSKLDRFTVLVGPAPPGDNKPADIWKPGSPLTPKNPKKVVIKVQYCKEGEAVPPGATDDTKKAIAKQKKEDKAKKDKKEDAKPKEEEKKVEKSKEDEKKEEEKKDEKPKEDEKKDEKPKEEEKKEEKVESKKEEEVGAKEGDKKEDLPADQEPSQIIEEFNDPQE